MEKTTIIVLLVLYAISIIAIFSLAMELRLIREQVEKLIFNNIMGDLPKIHKENHKKPWKNKRHTKKLAEHKLVEPVLLNDRPATTE